MDFSAEAWLPQGVGLAILVFVAELCVVTISTVRIIFIARGMKGLAALLGFFEITIWLFAIGQIMQHFSDLGCYLGFAGGFTLGNFLGVMLEKRLGLGTLTVRTVTRHDATQLVDHLRAEGYGVTSHSAEGASGPVKIVFSVIQRKQLDNVLSIIHKFAPDAFCAVDQVHAVTPASVPARKAGILPSILPFRPPFSREPQASASSSAARTSRRA